MHTYVCAMTRSDVDLEIFSPVLTIRATPGLPLLPATSLHRQRNGLVDHLQLSFAIEY